MFTGVLNQSGFKNNIDWGYLVFLGVIGGLAEIMQMLKLDQWLMRSIQPVLEALSLGPLGFLIMVTLIVYFVRLFLKKIPAVILLMLMLVPQAKTYRIHPGVILLTILMAMESWFLPYQTDSYQIAYYSTDEKAFSHSQARKLMVAKFVTSLLAVAISVPYWRMLGLIQ